MNIDFFLKFSYCFKQKRVAFFRVEASGGQNQKFILSSEFLADSGLKIIGRRFNPVKINPVINGYYFFARGSLNLNHMIGSMLRDTDDLIRQAIAQLIESNVPFL